MHVPPADSPAPALSIAAVVLRVARVVAQQVLAAQIAAEFLHGVGQLIELVHAIILPPVSFEILSRKRDPCRRLME